MAFQNLDITIPLSYRNLGHYVFQDLFPLEKALYVMNIFLCVACSFCHIRPCLVCSGSWHVVNTHSFNC
jgi:hypothetical protein